jgi:hypothetical protein
METPTQLLLNYCQESLFFSWQHRACLSVATTNSYVQYKTNRHNTNKYNLNYKLTKTKEAADSTRRLL